MFEPSAHCAHVTSFVSPSPEQPPAPPPAPSHRLPVSHTRTPSSIRILAQKELLRDQTPPSRDLKDNLDRRPIKYLNVNEDLMYCTCLIYIRKVNHCPCSGEDHEPGSQVSVQVNDLLASSPPAPHHQSPSAVAGIVHQSGK